MVKTTTPTNTGRCGGAFARVAQNLQTEAQALRERLQQIAATTRKLTDFNQLSVPLDQLLHNMGFAQSDEAQLTNGTYRLESNRLSIGTEKYQVVINFDSSTGTRCYHLNQTDSIFPFALDITVDPRGRLRNRIYTICSRVGDQPPIIHTCGTLKGSLVALTKQLSQHNKIDLLQHADEAARKTPSISHMMVPPDRLKRGVTTPQPHRPAAPAPAAEERAPTA